MDTLISRRLRMTLYDIGSYEFGYNWRWNIYNNMLDVIFYHPQKTYKHDNTKQFPIFTSMWFLYSLKRYSDCEKIS